MTVTLHATSKIVQLVTPEAPEGVPARIWEGMTAAGIACHAYITRIAVARDLDAAEFERELLEQRAPSAAMTVIPTRLVL
jgi:hypothetical protein